MITTGPVNDLQNWQAEFNGLLIGAGTDFGFPQALDLLALHTVRNMDYSRIWSDGDYSGPDFTDVTTPDLPIEVYATSPDRFFQDVMAFMGAFGPQTGDLPLWIHLPGMPVMGVPARVNSRTLPADYSWGTFAQGSVQFRLTNATWQSAPTSTVLSGNTEQQSGLVAPLGTTAVPYMSHAWTGTPNASTSTESVNGVVQRTNLLPNPQGGSAWFTNNNAGTGVTVLDPSDLPAGASHGVQYTATSYAWMGDPATLTQGITYTLSMWIRSATAGTAHVGQYASSIPQMYVSLAANTWTQVTYTVTSTSTYPGAVGFGVDTTDSNTIAIADPILVQGAAAGPYFDGDTGSYGAYTSPGVLDAGMTSSSTLTMQAMNMGNTDCWPVIQVKGPCDGFEVIVGGHIVTSSDHLSDGQTAVLDYGAGIYTVDGSYRNTFLTSRDWAPIPAGGAANIRYVADGGTATILTADTWR